MAPGNVCRRRIEAEQDPIAAFLNPPEPSEYDPLVEDLMVATKQDFRPSGDIVSEEDHPGKVKTLCGEGTDSEVGIATRQKELLEKELRATQSENSKLRLQIKQQFQDLGELDSVMGELEAQVDVHEAVIKQQDLRIQEQEEMIQQLNTRMQQYAAVLVCNAFKTRYF